MSAEAELLKLAKQTLKKVFKTGTESVPRSELENLFKSGVGERVFHTSPRPSELAKKGFVDPLSRTEYDMSDFFQDMPGLYYGKQPNLQPFFRDKVKTNVEGIIRPGAKIRDVDYLSDIPRKPGESDMRFYNRSDEFTERAIKNPRADFFKRSWDLNEEGDIEAGLRHKPEELAKSKGKIEELIQQKPGNVLAKIRTRKGKEYYRILALLAALKKLQESDDNGE